jgi:hypothetical protein
MNDKGGDMKNVKCQVPEFRLNLRHRTAKMLLFCKGVEDGLVYGRMMNVIYFINLIIISAYRGSCRWTPAKRPGRNMIVSE